MKPGVILAAGFSAWILLLASPSVAAAEAIGGVPARPDPSNNRTRSIFLHTIQPGRSTADAVKIVNNSDKEVTVLLYATDGIMTNSGTLSCKQQTEVSSGAGPWIALDRSEIMLAPMESREVPFTISVPSGARPGEHNGCVVFQTKDSPGTRNGALNLHFRSAIRVAITVPGELRKQLDISDFRIEWRPRSHIYHVALQNEGNVSVDVAAGVELRGLLGNVKFDAGDYPVLPMSEQKLRFSNERLPFWGGFYLAQATAGFDTRPEVFGTDESSTFTTLVSKKKLVLIVPALPALLLYVLTILGVGRLLYRRFLRARAAVAWEVYTARRTESLVRVAASRSISWRTLARVNRIKPPYQLEKGQKLYVPPKRK